jgi:hypothetical protein
MIFPPLKRHQISAVPLSPIHLPRISMSLASNRAHRILRGALNAGVRNHLVLVMSHCRLSDRAHIALARIQHIGVVRRQHGGRGAHDRAQRVVELLGFGLLHGRLERRAGGGFGAVQAGDGRVLVEVVVVVGGGAYDGALRWGTSACGSDAKGGDGEIVGGRRTVWPSTLRSTSGWFGGSTLLVVPMTGQVAMVVYVCVCVCVCVREGYSICVLVCWCACADELCW